MIHRLFLSFCFSFLIFSVAAQEKVVIENNPDYKFQSEKRAEEAASAQKRKNDTFQRTWSFGGNIGFSFWNGGTDILLAPKAYYNVSPKFITGFGVTYIYSDYDDRFFGYHQNSIGGSIMAAVRPVPMLQLSAEYEALHTNRGGYRADQYWNNAIYLGAAFVAGNVSFGFRYDVLYDANRSVYGSAWNPVIGFYF